MAEFTTEQAVPEVIGRGFFLSVRAVDGGKRLLIQESGDSSGSADVAISILEYDTLLRRMSAPQIVTPRGTIPGSAAAWGDADAHGASRVAAWQDIYPLFDPADGQDAAAFRSFDGRTLHWGEIDSGGRYIMHGGLDANTPVHCLRLPSGRIFVVYVCFSVPDNAPQIRGRFYDPVSAEWSDDTLFAEGLAGLGDWSNWPMYVAAGRGSVDEVHLLLYDDPTSGVDPEDYRDSMIYTRISEYVDTGEATVFNPKVPGGIVTVDGRQYIVASGILAQEDEVNAIYRFPMGIGINQAGDLVVLYQEHRTTDDKYDYLYMMLKESGGAWTGPVLLRDWQTLYGDPGPPPVPGFLASSGVSVASYGLTFHFAWDERRLTTAPGDGNSDIYHMTAEVARGAGAEGMNFSDPVRVNSQHSADPNSYEDMLPKIAIGEETGDVFIVWQDTVAIIETETGPVGAKWAYALAAAQGTSPESEIPTPEEACVPVVCEGGVEALAPLPLETQGEDTLAGSGNRRESWYVP